MKLTKDTLIEGTIFKAGSSIELESTKVKESEVRDIIDQYPKAMNLVSKVSETLNWDIFAVMSFCLELLHDVNAHSEAKEIDEIFTRQMKEW